MSNIEFRTIVPLIKAGDKEAWSSLMEHFFDWSVAQALEVIRDQELARDVAVDFWAELEESIHKFDEQRGSFYGWMALQLRSMALDAARVNRPRIEYSDADLPEREGGSGDPEQAHQAQADLSEIQRRLTPRQVRVLGMLCRGFTAKEIAAELHVQKTVAHEAIRDVRRIAKDYLKRSAK